MINSERAFSLEEDSASLRLYLRVSVSQALGVIASTSTNSCADFSVSSNAFLTGPFLLGLVKKRYTS